MTKKEAFDKIIAMLGLEDYATNFSTETEVTQDELESVQLDTQALMDGAIVEYVTWETGVEIFIQTEEGLVPLADGEYETAEGVFFTVLDGKIETITEPETEEVDETEETEETEEVIDHAAIIAELEAKIAELEALLGVELTKVTELETQVVELSKEPAGSPVIHTPAWKSSIEEVKNNRIDAITALRKKQ